MNELYEARGLADALHEARRRTLSIYAHLDLANLRVPYLATINPPLWEVAHIAHFQEFWCLRYRPDDPSGSRTPSLLANSDAMFDSRVIPHRERWDLAYPSVEAIFHFMEQSLDRTLQVLDETPPDRRYFFDLALRHEDMHGEALLMTLQTLGLPAPGIAVDPPVSVPLGQPREVVFDGAEFLMGTLPDTPEFTFDNEKWAHMASVRAFNISLDPVSQGEFAAFVEEGGYRRGEMWTAEGWKWREQGRIESPRYWKRNGGGWLVRRFDRWLPIDFAAPMVNVSLHEALAYCRWAERRLPTEAEWEYAARNAGRPDRFPWGDAPAPRAEALDFTFSAPSSTTQDPAPSRTGIRQLLGGVWEWTSTPFLPYPGFRADPYKEYSEPWFGSHFVLRGGCFATRRRLIHNRFRNFYLPERGDVFAGLRTCAVEAA